MLAEIPEAAGWAIFFLPMLSFILISFIIRPFFNNRPRLAGYITIACIGASFLLSLWALDSVRQAANHRLDWGEHQWVTIGTFSVRLRLIMDSLTAVMLIVVTGVSLMVQIYSQGYMHGDPGYPRYFAFMSLFTGSMLGIVLAGNLVMVYVFWELVGLCSYLLIGFWFHRPSAAAAAKKAFIVTRLGDFGFLAAILWVYFTTHTFDIGELRSLAMAGTLGGATLTWFALGVFAGAAGKSAQFPLHVWLPDAMEGPTPVSALIHAATMVAAGVFLVARLLPIFDYSSQAMNTVAVIGAFTAIFAASMGLVMNDIKRVVAYSTISQLGYMMLGLGTGSVAIGIFHLFNHAFFKALLFLGAGSVNHATGTFDMRQMGGLRKVMPWTYVTFVIAALSLAGIYPLSGFWSKDEILARAWDHNRLLFSLALITVFLTAFYIFRVVFMTFGGEYRGSPASHDAAQGHHASALHESPQVMLVPMVILSIMAIFSGWFNLGGGFASFLSPAEPVRAEEVVAAPGPLGILTHPLPWISLLIAGSGILLAYLMYSAKRISLPGVSRMFSPVHTMLSRKYWLDELYEGVIVGRVMVNGIFTLLQLFDTYIVDGIVNGIAQGTVAAGSLVRKAQTGQLQAYGLAIFLGVIAVAGYLFWRFL